MTNDFGCESVRQDVLQNNYLPELLQAYDE